MKKNIAVAKHIPIGAFLVLLLVTYYLRSEVWELNTIHFTTENIP